MRWCILAVLLATLAVWIGVFRPCPSTDSTLPLLNRPLSSALSPPNTEKDRLRRFGQSSLSNEWLIWLRSLDLNDEQSWGELESVPVSQLPSVLNELSNTNSSESQELASALISRWAEEDIDGAVAWVRELPEEAFRAIAWEHVATAWAGKDLPAVMEWLRSSLEGESKSAAIRAAAYEAARADPVAALQLAVDLPPDEQRDELLAHSVMQWMEANPDQAAEWVSRIPDEHLRTRLLEAVAVALAAQDPAAAAGFVSRNIAPGDEQNRAAIVVAAQWIQTAPESASVWVNQFPPGAVLEAGREAVSSLSLPLDGAGNTMSSSP
jgi:hypothetical protein